MTRTPGLALLLLLSACATMPPPAQDGPPSDESLHRLLDVTNQQQLVQNLRGQMDAMLQATMQKTLKGKTLSSQEQAILDEMRARMTALMDDELSWQSMEPMTMDIYRKSFTQGEVNDMIAFYSTPAGHAVITKMPVVAQNTMQIVQARMETLHVRIEAIEKDAMARLKALDKGGPGHDANAAGSP